MNCGFSDLRILSTNGENLNVLLRAYYPTNDKAASFLNRSLWLPSSKYFHGLMEFGKPRGKWFLSLIGPLLSKFIRQPSNFVHDAKPAVSDSASVVLMSHGLGGFRGMYSAVAEEIVKRGHVVLALEHGDGSGCCFDYGNSEYLYYSGYPKGRGWEYRREQLAHRDNEINVVLSALGIHVNNAGSPSFDILTSFPYEILRNRPIDFAAHSFGCAAIINYLNTFGRSIKGSKFLLMDPWLEPLIEGLDLEHTTRLKERMDEIEFTVVNSDSFHWDQNVTHMNSILGVDTGTKIERGASQVDNTNAFIIENSIHMQFSDIPQRAPFMKGGTDVTRITGLAFEQLLNRKRLF
jgi:platelet-activating factor acetylhydrolase